MMADTPMRERIVEAMARARCVEAGLDPDQRLWLVDAHYFRWEFNKKEQEAALDAALEVMMEPDEESIRAGDCFIHHEPDAEPNTIGKWVLKPTALKKDTP